MKRLLIAAALCLLPLAACVPSEGPATTANVTVLDEQVGIGAEAAYTTAATLGAALAQAGVIDKAKFQALDRQAYDALLVVRTAYAAGNATDYATAATKVYATVAQIKALVK